jgi:hypothetical protein
LAPLFVHLAMEWCFELAIQNGSEVHGKVDHPIIQEVALLVSH